jgi:hypothetical protein
MSKFVGQVVYRKRQAERFAVEHGWEVRRGGSAWRRVVPFTEAVRPRRALGHHKPAGRRCRVICSGGGGIPVVRDDHGQVCGIEAAIDKDRTAALLAKLLGADALLLRTDVAAVEADSGCPPPARSGAPRSSSFGGSSSQRGPWAQRWKRPVTSSERLSATLRLGGSKVLSQCFSGREKGSSVGVHPSESREPDPMDDPSRAFGIPQIVKGESPRGEETRAQLAQ